MNCCAHQYLKSATPDFTTAQPSSTAILFGNSSITFCCAGIGWNAACWDVSGDLRHDCLHPTLLVDLDFLRVPSGYPSTLLDLISVRNFLRPSSTARGCMESIIEPRNCCAIRTARSL
jgi:hypothetical protein